MLHATHCRFCNQPIHLVGRWWELTGVSGDTYCPYGVECREHESCPAECSSMTHQPGDPAPAVTAFEDGRTAERELREVYGFATAGYNSGAAFAWSRTADELADVNWESWVAGWNTSVADARFGGESR